MVQICDHLDLFCAIGGLSNWGLVQMGVVQMESVQMGVFQMGVVQMGVDPASLSLFIGAVEPPVAVSWLLKSSWHVQPFLPPPLQFQLLNWHIYASPTFSSGKKVV